MRPIGVILAFLTRHLRGIQNEYEPEGSTFVHQANPPHRLPILATHNRIFSGVRRRSGRRRNIRNRMKSVGSSLESDGESLKVRRLRA